MSLLKSLLPITIATAKSVVLSKGACYRRGTKIINQRTEQLLRKKTKTLELELNKTKSALEDFGRERLSVMKEELKKAERILSEFYGKKVLVINEKNFQVGEFLSGNSELAFGAFGKKCASFNLSKPIAFLSPLSFKVKEMHALNNACEFNYRVSVLCKAIEERIQCLVAIRERTLEGKRVLSFLKGKLCGLLKDAENSAEWNTTIFRKIFRTALTLQKAVEMEVCSPDGILARKTGELFKIALEEVDEWMK